MKKQGDNYRVVPYFEAHITVEWKNEGDDKLFEGRCNQHGWSFSRIQNDIILGSGVKMYATRHYDHPHFKKDEIIQDMDDFIELLQLLELNVIREKVECVIYDKVVES